MSDTKNQLPFSGIMVAGTTYELSEWTKRIGYADKLWPTPMARLGTVRGPQAKRYEQKGRSIDLDDAVAHFGGSDVPAGVLSEQATEAVGGVLSGSDCEGSSTLPDGSVAADEPTEASEGMLTWPTPTARDGKSGAGGSVNRQGGMNLRTAVLQFPTPTARDWKSCNASPTTMNRNSRPLSEVVTGGKTGTLNPRWVEWLMGFEQDWTVV